MCFSPRQGVSVDLGIPEVFSRVLFHAAVCCEILAGPQIL